MLLIFLVTWPGGSTGPVPSAPPSPGATDTLRVDLAQTVVRWKGTKFWGLGKHEGVVRLASGELQVQSGNLMGGTFVIDMTTIAVTDIPAHEPVPRRRLENHLKSDDFFAVGSYPAARFKLDEVNRQGGQRYRVTGTLTMRGRSHPVTFDARVETTEPDALVARAQFSIDRQKWGVAYRGSRLTDDLVDDEIHLDLYLVAGR
jgi:polyisoprenoid-binding protein YceI